MHLSSLLLKYTQYLILMGSVLTMVSCSKSDNSPAPAPTPEEDLTTPVAGVYTLTKVTAQSSGTVVTGIGSLTIVAVDKTTANITQVRSFTNTSTGAVSKITSVPNEPNKIAKNGSNYVIKSTNGNQWATISGSKISTVDQMGTPTITLDTEYTK